MVIKVKVQVKEVEGSENVCQKVLNTLESDSANAYTVGGLMIEKFGVKEKDIDGLSFKDWKPGHPTLYSRIKKCLERSVVAGRVKKAKHGRAYVYWWAGKPQ